MFAAAIVLLAMLVTAVLSLPSSAFAEDCHPWPDGGGLQAALNQYRCVFAQAGTYVLDEQQVIPPGHELRCAGWNVTKFVAAPSFPWGQALIASGTQDALAVMPVVRDCALDGGHVTTFVAAYMGMTLDTVIVQNGACEGVRSIGPGFPPVVIRNSIIRGNGWPTQVPGRGLMGCPVGPHYHEPKPDDGNPRPTGGGAGGSGDNLEIVDSIIINNYGGGIDVGGTKGTGRILRNTIAGNQFGIGLFGAQGWLVEDNMVSADLAPTIDWFWTACLPPDGPHPAAIIVCPDQWAGREAIGNVIRRNHLSADHPPLVDGGIGTIAEGNTFNGVSAAPPTRLSPIRCRTRGQTRACTAR
jgi:hypothetical protein